MQQRGVLSRFCITALLALAFAHPPSASQEQPPRFRAEAQVIEVDVIVKDASGRFVEGLTRDDFEIYEDGRPQHIDSAFLVRSSAAAEPTAVQRAGAARAPRLFVLLFDQHHMPPGSFKRLQEATIAFLRDRFEPGDVSGIVAGGRMLNDRLTTDREELIATVSRLKPSGERAARFFDLNEWPRFLNDVEAVRVNSGDAEAIRQVVTRASADQPGGRFDAEGAARAKAAKFVSEMRTSALETLRTLETVAAGLRRFPGRKTLIVVTSGFFIDETWARLPAIVGRAARSGVTIYTIDARGLDRRAGGRDVTSGALATSDMRALTAFDNWQDAPNSLAVDSGGFVVRNTNDVGRAFTEIAEDTSTYYVLGYSPATPFDGKYRSIEVRVRRRGVTVRARKGYLAEAGPTTVTNSAAGRAPDSSPATATVLDVARAPMIRARLEALRHEAAALAPAIDALLSTAPRKALAALQRQDDASHRGAVDLLAGLAQFAVRDDEGAVAALTRAVESLPKDPLPSFVLGWVHSTAGRDREAAGAYRNTAVVDPGSIPAHLALADTYLRMSQPQLAIQALRAGLAANPDSAELKTRLAALERESPDSAAAAAPAEIISAPAAERDGSAENAAATVPPAVRPRAAPAERVVQLAPVGIRGASTSATEGWMAYERGDVTAAARLLTEAAAESDAAPWVHYALGFARLAGSDTAGAARAWEQVRQAAPDFQPVYLDLADAYMQLRAEGTAVAVLREAQRRWPTEAEVHNALGVVQVRRGAIDDAVESFRAAVTNAPEDPLGYFNLGRTYHLRFLKSRRYNREMRRWFANEEDRTRAIEAFEKCIDLDGTYSAAARDAVAALQWQP